LRIGLFIPCYVDQLYPDVGLATLELLERFDLEVVYPEQQTCCGQPMANTGCTEEARPFARRFLEIFGSFDYVVAPSGSCVAMVRHHYHEFLHGVAGFTELQDKTKELCEFLVDVLKVEKIEGSFPYQVGLHASCHGLRELRMAAASEVMTCRPNKTRQLLEGLEGIRFSDLERVDECCGFGGTFAVAEAAVSARMGMDRLEDHRRAGTEVLTAADMSCLMHLEGLLRRDKSPMHVLHVAQILAGRQPESPGG
jgi:L-lactate dehydrogenase complex protein LldE